jgi:hypothetical protein
MAAGDLTYYGNANQPESGLMTVVGESVATTAATVVMTFGFEPQKIVFRATGAANATVGNIYTYLKAIGVAINELVTASTGAVTFVATTARAIVVSQNATTGVWTVTILAAVQTAEHFFVIEVYR